MATPAQAPDITSVVRTTAAKYLGGDVSGLSKADFAAKVKTLATQQPDKAEQLVEAVGNAIDKATGGKYAGKVDELQRMSRQALGL